MDKMPAREVSRNLKKEGAAPSFVSSSAPAVADPAVRFLVTRRRLAMATALVVAELAFGQREARNG